MARVTLVHGIDTNAIPWNFGRIWMRKYGMADDVGIASLYYNFEYDRGSVDCTNVNCTILIRRVIT